MGKVKIHDEKKKKFMKYKLLRGASFSSFPVHYLTLFSRSCISHIEISHSG